ncbi:MAG: 2-hydroxy-3-oxopropionate reductase [Alphaproteobacteria bacterium MarineAlpha5_Bin12]|nr:3-hydroxyisobutyrate dehydrogenase [Pelagibacteraceae bacterium]PPR41909.1 MAG: 2-hydroxy-3-oxopropionate reductase [Alphaproteobacteria bacterium MarineAlpha5_Bin12]|tara:strand:- start:487 stop:1431 length:945 start_codon:yes stop_codon:yes gene_type:complete
MKVGFIGLGNVGSKLANTLLKKDVDLTVLDKNKEILDQFKKSGAKISKTPKDIAKNNELIITCLPSPKISSEVIESKNGIIEGLSKGKIWLEMSTTDSSEVIRLGKIFESLECSSLDAPVSGGCHRAATGNISIFVGGNKDIFNSILPILSIMGKDIIYTGKLGSASILKVITNFLASTHLVALGEALMVAKKSNIDLDVAYKAIKSSSGNSFVHETESQVILNGSYKIDFTMDLVLKDINLFNELSKLYNIPTEISSLLIKIFNEGSLKYGKRAWSSMIVKRIEDHCNVDLRAKGYPAELIDKEIESQGIQIK